MSHCYDVINATYRTYPWLFLFLDIYEPSRQEPSLELIFHNFSNFVQEKAESARSDQEGGVGTHRQQAAHQHSFLLYKSPFQNRGSNFSLRNSQTSMAFRTNKSVTRLFMIQPHFSLWRIGVKVPPTTFSILDLSWSGFFFRTKQPPNVVLQRTIFQALHVCTEAWKMETQCVNIFVRLKCCSKHFLISSYL